MADKTVGGVFFLLGILCLVAACFFIFGWKFGLVLLALTLMCMGLAIAS